MYTTRSNEILNFVCIYPDTHQDKADDTWNRPGSMQELLKNFEGFDQRVRGLLKMADESTLKEWTLTDMNAVSQWHQGSFCLVGDAAHPFLPHQGQGAAQAIEDGIALGVIFPLGVTPEEVPDRLSLYQKCRKERAEHIQGVTRQSGDDIQPEQSDNAVRVMSFFNYNFAHDEHDSATLKLRDWLYKQQRNVYWKMPLSFGPSPSPRQNLHGDRLSSDNSILVSRSIKFKTSRTVAQNFFPTSALSFDGPDSYAYASLVVNTLDKMEWLGGAGYNYVGLYLHNVRYTKTDTSIVTGDYLVVMWENLTDPILTGREEVGYPKLYSDIDIQESPSSTSVVMSWRNAEYLKIKIDDLEECAVFTQSANEGVLTYKYIPATGQPGIADVEYAVYVPPKPIKVNRLQKSPKSGFNFNVHDSKTLPTLHHMVTGLAELPVYEIEEATVSESTGPDDLMTAYKIE